MGRESIVGNTLPYRVEIARLINHQGEGVHLSYRRTTPRYGWIERKKGLITL